MSSTKKYTLIIGEDELAMGSGALKDMDAGCQKEVRLAVEAIETGLLQQ